MIGWGPERARRGARAVREAWSRLGGITIGLREAIAIGLLCVLGLTASGAMSWGAGLAALAVMAAGGGTAAWRRAGDGGSMGRTSRQAMEASREADEPLLAALLAGLPDAAFVLDGEGRLLAANTPARDLFPVAPGRHITQVTRAPDLLAAVEEAQQRGEPLVQQVRLTPPHERTLAARVTPLARAGGTRGGRILVVLRDMTEQEQLSRMRADFVANASHELRTPLASLKGFVETLQGAARDDATAREQFLAIMHEQASRMSRLIDDLLSLSRIEMREHVAPVGSVDLSAIVDEVATTLRPLAAGASIRIDTGGLVRPAAVIGDRDELAQVVQNLMQNAIKYGRSGGRVAVTVAPDGRSMRLAVEDDGIGIAPEHLPRLTERFYRVSAKESRERGGTGLGLAIVKHIVSRHRGELEIRSTPGRGSRFSVLIPRPQGSNDGGPGA